MPRRPRKQPRPAARKAPAPVKKSDAKLKKWVRREDIEGDDEDNFHTARDRILLEGDDVEGNDSDDGEEEVFGLGIDDDDSEDESETEDAETEPAPIDEDDSHAPRKRKKTNKSAPEPELSPSDNESEESESWGRKKSAYYASNAASLAEKEGEEDEEEANEMEEREARRIQTRLRDGMVDDDYGLNDDVETGAQEDLTLDADEPEDASKSSAVLPVPGLHLDKAAALRHLAKTSPETLALAREWDDVAHDLFHIQDRLDKLESTTPDPVSLGLSHLHHQTLLTYVTTLAFYLHLRSAPASQTQRSALLSAVLERLLTLKQALSIMEDLDFDASDEDGSEWDSEASDLDEEGLVELSRLIGGEGRVSEDDMSYLFGKRRKRLEEGELEALLQEAAAEPEEEERPKKRAKKTKDAATSHSGDPADHNIANVQKRTSKVLFDLAEPEFVPTSTPAPRAVNGGLDSYGEATTLSMADDADKKARRRTLRFHTSKIENSVRRKEGARERMGGDDDLPYRERNKEKEARVRREVEKTRGEGGDDLDPEGDVEMSESAGAAATSRNRNEDEEGSPDEEAEDGYYELVRRNKERNKENKKQQYDEARASERMDTGADEDASGPRSLTREILKNKGLTPRRSKSVRNPRVKKRERFEKAKKKVRSQKAVFKGGLAGKPYGGEESGITKVVKSIKL